MSTEKYQVFSGNQDKPNKVQQFGSLQIGVRKATLEERILATENTEVSKRLGFVVEDLHRNDTGWRNLEIRNAGNQLMMIKLVSKDGKYAVDFYNPVLNSGTQDRVTIAKAHAFAIDYAYEVVVAEHEYNGFNVTPIWTLSGLGYSVSSLEHPDIKLNAKTNSCLYPSIETAYTAIELENERTHAHIEQTRKLLNVQKDNLVDQTNLKIKINGFTNVAMTKEIPEFSVQFMKLVELSNKCVQSLSYPEDDTLRNLTSELNEAINCVDLKLISEISGEIDKRTRMKNGGQER